MKNYLIVIENAGENYCAYCPDVCGCVTSGDSVEETIQNMKEALEFHLEEETKTPVAHTLEWHLKNGLQFEKGSIFAHVNIKTLGSSPLSMK